MPSLTNNLWEFGEFRLDAQNRVLKRGQEQVALPPKAFELLLILIQHGGQLVSKDDLMKAVWPDSFVEESNLTQTVFLLRKALGETSEKRYIVTVQGRGYRFVAGVREIQESGEVEKGTVAARAEAFGASSSGPLRNKKFWLRFAGVGALIVVTGLIAHGRWGVVRTPPKTPGGRLMVAVLPFQNLTGDAGQEYFSDGLTEEMITRLGNLDPEHFGVIARTSVVHYRDSQTPLDQIGRELGVQYVIEGSVRRDANEVRITAQLIQTKDQTHVWSRQYDRELKGLLALQGEIANEVADEIQLTLGTQQSARPLPAISSPNSFEAYDLYLKGQYQWNKRTAQSLRLAAEYFEQATAKDPGFARAYAGLADANALIGGYSGLPQKEFIAKARAAALRALELDANLPEAHTALALIVQNYDWDWQTAEKEFRRSIELNPNYATAHHWFAEHLMWRGRFEEALRESERARQLDPLSLIIAADNGMILFYSRRYDEAEKKLKSVMEMEPDFPRAHMIRNVYLAQGNLKAADQDIREYRMREIPWDLVYVLGREGQTANAKHALEQMKELDKRQPIDPFEFAWAYLGMGEKELALAQLEKAYSQHSQQLTMLKVEPAWDPVRSEPRFQDVLRRTGLAD